MYFIAWIQKMNDYLVYGIGILAQLLFSARLIIQWLKSEKAGRVLSPTIFWQLSLMASFLLVVYGILRDDIVIILGQVFSYFIYIRNLQYKNALKLIPTYFKVLIIVFPIIAIVWLSSDLNHNWYDVVNNPSISEMLLVWGTAGQVIFAVRFIYQWYFSERRKKSVLPAGFWLISVVGSLMIITYGIFRKDPILVLGQIFGLFIYIRNLYLMYSNNQFALKKN